MISLNHSVSGGEIGRLLVDDPEEMADLLSELDLSTNEKFGGQVADYIIGEEAKRICQFLRRLADQIEAAA